MTRKNQKEMMTFEKLLGILGRNHVAKHLKNCTVQKVIDHGVLSLLANAPSNELFFFFFLSKKKGRSKREKGNRKKEGETHGMWGEEFEEMG